MIKLEHLVEATPDQMIFIIEGMRNPMNSWEKADSEKVTTFDISGLKEISDKSDYIEWLELGPNDGKLMSNLSKAGSDHRKFMRMMPIYIRVTAPLYWWKEFDTYKIGTVSNSCSTMHKIADKEFKPEDFSMEHLTADDAVRLIDLIYYLNDIRSKYCLKNSKDDWWKLIQMLPSSYNQTRNIYMNYEVAYNIIKERKEHKLDEWREFCLYLEDHLEYSFLFE